MRAALVLETTSTPVPSVLAALVLDTVALPSVRAGLVSAVAEAPHPPEKIATVRPAAKLRKVEEVLVLRAAADLPRAREADPSAARR